MIGLMLAVTIAIHASNVFGPPPKPSPDTWSSAAAPSLRPIAATGADGTMLRGWFVPAVRSDAPYVLFFYGSNEDVLLERNRLEWLASLGVNAACFDYRGYGFSGGTPAVGAIRDDALRVFDELSTHVAPPGARIFVYGWSVGTQLAIHVAANRTVAGVVLQAPPASADAMDAASRKADVPALARWAVRLKSDDDVRAIYQGAKEARSVVAPMLIIEGAQDTTVPPAQAREVLDAAASADKSFILVAGASHNDLRFREPPASIAVSTFLSRR